MLTPWHAAAMRPMSMTRSKTVLRVYRESRLSLAGESYPDWDPCKDVEQNAKDAYHPPILSEPGNWSPLGDIH